MEALQLAALVLGALASLATIIAFVEARRSRKRDRPRDLSEVIIFPEDRGAEVKLERFVDHWRAFVNQHFPQEDPASCFIPVGAQKASFEGLNYRNGLDAMCRLLAEQRDRMQITNRFWALNRRYFERVMGRSPQTDRTIQMVRLSGDLRKRLAPGS